MRREKSIEISGSHGDVVKHHPDGVLSTTSFFFGRSEHWCLLVDGSRPLITLTFSPMSIFQNGMMFTVDKKAISLGLKAPENALMVKLNSI